MNVKEESKEMIGWGFIVRTILEQEWESEENIE